MWCWDQPRKIHRRTCFSTSLFLSQYYSSRSSILFIVRSFINVIQFDLMLGKSRVLVVRKVGQQMKSATRWFGTSSKAWLQRQRSDKWSKDAKEQDLRSRSAFKLKEVQAKYSIIKPDSVILDLGAAPGGWSLISSSYVDSSRGGRIIAVDLLSMAAVPNTHFISGDFTSSSVQKEIIKELSKHNSSRFDLIVSDMLHNTTGNREMDHFKSMSLVQSVISFALDSRLSPKGAVLCKFLRGGDEKELLEDCKQKFVLVDVFKPKSSRSESREAFILMRGLL